jgi:hypothetical protein
MLAVEINPVKQREIGGQESFTVMHLCCVSVSRFQEKEKRGEMITINDNIN